MFKLYSTYIASNFIVPFLVSTVFFVSFLMTFEIFRIMSFMVSEDISFGFILELIGNVMVTLIPLGIPLSIFFSTIYCLNQMSNDSEYVAMRAAGLSKLKILTPFLLIALTISLCVVILNNQLVPNAHKSVRKKIKIVSTASLIKGLKSGQFFTSLPNVTIFPQKVDEKTQDLQGVFLHTVDENNRQERVIMAEKGRIIHKKDEEQGLESFKLYLEDGNILKTTPGKDDLEKILFKEYTLPISEQKFSYRTSMKEIMMNYQELNQFIAQGFEKAKSKGFDKRDFFNAKYEFWNRTNTPIACLIFTFLGFCLGVSGSRGRKKNTGGRTILLLIGYYILYFGLVSAARDELVPVALCALIPNLVFLVFALKKYQKLDWQS